MKSIPTDSYSKLQRGRRYEARRRKSGVPP